MREELPLAMEPETVINGHADTVALASLVRVASSFHLQPNRKSTTDMAPICRTEMDRRHDQRFGAALGLSEGSECREILVGAASERSPQSAAPHAGQKFCRIGTEAGVTLAARISTSQTPRSHPLALFFWLHYFRKPKGEHHDGLDNTCFG
jgi:hypothetical protein